MALAHHFTFETSAGYTWGQLPEGSLIVDVGGGLGAALGLGGVLLKRGDEINLVKGTNLEMVLQAPLNLEAEQAAANARYVSPREVFPENTTPVVGPETRPARNQRRRAAGGLPWPGIL